MWQRQITDFLVDVFQRTSALVDSAMACPELVGFDWGQKYWYRAQGISADPLFDGDSFEERFAHSMACWINFLAAIGRCPNTFWRRRVIGLLGEIIPDISTRLFMPVYKVFGSEIDWGQYEWLQAKQSYKDMADGQNGEEFSYALVEFGGRWFDMVGKILLLPEQADQDSQSALPHEDEYGHNPIVSVGF